MRRFLVLALDVLLCVSAAVALAIFVTGGGVFQWDGHLVRAERARNALWIFFGAALLRVAFGGAQLFLMRGSVDAWSRHVKQALDRATDRLAATGERQRRIWMAGILLASGGLKLWNIVFYYGFTFGDDVEIHVMTFSALQGHDLGVWSLRSPVFPLIFIYPFQWALTRIGVTEPGPLIAAGRCVVMTFSLVNLWLVYRLAARVFAAPTVGVLAAYLLALSRIPVQLGSSELPRTVASTFLLLAAGWVFGERGVWRAALAGLATGVAGSLRFSEAIFVVPLALYLVQEKRYRDVLAAAAGTLTAFVVALGPGDLLFWPEAFYSFRHIVDFTLVRNESSRGFEPLGHYLLDAPWWSDPFTLALVVWGWRSSPRALRLWAVLPVLLLSLFPHKEERYLIPVLPFLLLIAAFGAWRLLSNARAATNPRAAVWALLVLSGATLLELEGFRFRRSEAAVDVARFLASRGARSVAMEEATSTTGANLYLMAPTTRLMNLETRRLREGAYPWDALSCASVQYVVLSERTFRDVNPALLREAGFLEIEGPPRRHRGGYRIFECHGPVPSL